MTTLRHLFTVAVCTTLLLSASQAEAQSWPPLNDPSSVEKSGANDVALLIGVEDYTYLPDVEGAAANLAEWERFFRQDLGMSRVLVLRDDAATKEEILRMADRAASEASADSRLWFVFVGHGAPDVSTSAPMLVGVDGQRTPNSVAARGVSRDELLARLESGKQKHTVAVLDACFSGRDADGDELLEGVQPVVPTAQLSAPANSTVMVAAAGDQVAGRLPGTRRPAFSYLVLGAMRGWADDGDGAVTASEAVEFARVELLGVPGRDQTPQLAGDSTFVLAAGVSESRPAVLSTGSVVATTDTPATTSETSAEASQNVVHTPDPNPESGDGQFDFPLFLRLAVGSSGTFDGPTQSVSGQLGLGWKFDGPGQFEYRSVLNVHFAGYKQFKEGDQIPWEFSTSNESFSGTAELQKGSALESHETGLIMASLGPGFAWRSEKAGSQFDHVVSAEMFGALGYVESYCDESEIYVDPNASSEDTILLCDYSSPLSAGVGARLGYTFKFLDVGFTAIYAFASNDVVISTTFGFSLDP